MKRNVFCIALLFVSFTTMLPMLGMAQFIHGIQGVESDPVNSGTMVSGGVDFADNITIFMLNYDSNPTNIVSMGLDASGSVQITREWQSVHGDYPGQVNVQYDGSYILSGKTGRDGFWPPERSVFKFSSVDSLSWV